MLQYLKLKGLHMNKKELAELIKSNRDLDEIEIGKVYDMFLSESQDAFDFAHDQKDFLDGVDSLMDSYEMWIYEQDIETEISEIFIDRTFDDMYEHFVGALT